MMKTALTTYIDSVDDTDGLLHRDEGQLEPRSVSESQADETEWIALNVEQRQSDDCSTFCTPGVWTLNHLDS